MRVYEPCAQGFRAVNPHSGGLRAASVLMTGVSLDMTNCTAEMAGGAWWSLALGADSGFQGLEAALRQVLQFGSVAEGEPG